VFALSGCQMISGVPEFALCILYMADSEGITPIVHHQLSILSAVCFYGITSQRQPLSSDSVPV
jgi:hypothetical protein